MKEPWMSQAIMYYGKVTAWIFIPIVAVMLLARYTSLSDSPIGMIALIIGCFAVTVFGIFRSIKSYKDTLK